MQNKFYSIIYKRIKILNNQILMISMIALINKKYMNWINKMLINKIKCCKKIKIK